MQERGNPTFQVRVWSFIVSSGHASLSQTFWPVFCRTIIGGLCRVFFARPISDVSPNFRCTTMLCIDSNRPDGMRWVNSLNSSSSFFAPFDHHAAGKRDCDGRTERHLHRNGQRHSSFKLSVAEEQDEYHRSNLIQRSEERRVG